MLKIVPIDTPGLGERSYLAHDGEVAIVVGPQRSPPAHGAVLFGATASDVWIDDGTSGVASIAGERRRRRLQRRTRRTVEGRNSRVGGSWREAIRRNCLATTGSRSAARWTRST